MEPLDAGLSVEQAAARLGITEPALRKRIRRGTVQAVKVGGVWRVTLSHVERVERAMGRGRRDRATNRNRDGDRDALIEQLRSEIHQARGEVAWLRSLVEELTRRVPKLPLGSPQPAPAPPSTMAPSGPETAVSQRTAPQPSPWYRRWFSRWRA